MTIAAIARGLVNGFRPRLLLAFWVVNVVLSAVVAIGWQQAVDPHVSMEPDAGQSAASVSPAWLDDVRRAQGPALAALSSTMGAVTWAWVLVSAVLAGGAIRAFDARTEEMRKAEGVSWSYRVFLADTGRHAFAMLRFLVLAVPLVVLVDFVFNEWLAGVFERYALLVESERASMLTEWARQVAFLASLFALATWLDLARVKLVVERRRSVFTSMVAAADDLIRRPASVIVVALVFVGLELAVMLAGAELLAGVRTDSWLALGGWLAGAQLVVLLRLGLGLCRLAGYATLVDEWRMAREA